MSNSSKSNSSKSSTSKHSVSRRGFIAGGAAVLAGAAMFGVTACGEEEQGITKSGLDPANFKTDGTKNINIATTDKYTGKPMDVDKSKLFNSSVPTGLYVLENKNGCEACITNVGARVVSLMVPDKSNNLKDVVLGFDKLEDYFQWTNQMGSICGRYANRIKNGQFTINGKTYQLPINDNTNTLHSGPNGFHFQTFEVEEHKKSEGKLVLKLDSPNDDAGFPGNLSLKVTYQLTDKNTLVMSVSATTDQDTVLNIANHAYFDVSGNPSQDTLHDKLFISSKQTTPIDQYIMPTGEIATIEQNGPFDFMGANASLWPEGKEIGKDLNVDNEQLKFGNGYDHNFCILDNTEAINAGATYSGELETDSSSPESIKGKGRLHARFYSPTSGIVMTIKSTEPGIQFYGSQGLTENHIGKGGVPFCKYGAIALETQHYPDSPNNSNFPSTILKAGETYESKTEYQFSTVS